MRMAPEAVRKTKAGDAEIAFQDAFPFMGISEASHDWVNARIEGEPVDISRWRATKVFAGCDAFEEDEMGAIVIGEVSFVGYKLCDRCNVPGYDQTTGKIDSRPLGVLAHNGRRWKDKSDKWKVWFGRNFVATSRGYITVGDEVHVLQKAKAA